MAFSVGRETRYAFYKPQQSNASILKIGMTSTVVMFTANRCTEFDMTGDTYPYAWIGLYNTSPALLFTDTTSPTTSTKVYGTSQGTPFPLKIVGVTTNTLAAETYYTLSSTPGNNDDVYDAGGNHCGYVYSQDPQMMKIVVLKSNSVAVATRDTTKDIPATTIGVSNLYYGNIKIKEAYYGRALVYSSFTPQTYRFDYTGAAQTWTVPAGCTKLIVDCVGAMGGSYLWDGEPAPAGKGGRVTCSLSVSPGQTLYIFVGGRGEDYYVNSSSSYGYIYNGGGFNGGGSNGEHRTGGGGTDIRIGGNTLNDRVVVAGGGGYADRNVWAGSTGFGGNGGDLVGQSVTVYGQVVATGGTQTSGGTSDAGSSGWGFNGSFGVGAERGGGGGWYGGAAYALNGGAGGSSYTHPTLCTNVVHTQGYSAATGNGWIIITTSR